MFIRPVCSCTVARYILLAPWLGCLQCLFSRPVPASALYPVGSTFIGSPLRAGLLRKCDAAGSKPVPGILHAVSPQNKPLFGRLFSRFGDYLEAFRPSILGLKHCRFAC
jgi:hypothetical protein